MSTGWTILMSIIGGGALLTFLQFLIQRHDEKKGKKTKLEKAIDRIAEEVAQLRSDMERQQATEARIRILRFGDELRHGLTRSKESYDQTMADIDAYEDYCAKHPEYPNGRTGAEVEYIRGLYMERLKNNDFLA